MSDKSKTVYNELVEEIMKLRDGWGPDFWQLSPNARLDRQMVIAEKKVLCEGTEFEERATFAFEAFLYEYKLRERMLTDMGKVNQKWEAFTSL